MYSGFSSQELLGPLTDLVNNLANNSTDLIWKENKYKIGETVNITVGAMLN
jgi:hypothetical protein